MKLFLKQGLYLIAVLFANGLYGQDRLELENDLDKNIAAGNYTAAAATFKKIYYSEPEDDRNPTFLYRSAYYYAKAKDGEKVLTLLDTAVAAGYTNFYPVRKIPDFDFLRKDPRWKAIEIRQLKAYKEKEDTFYWGLYYGLLTTLFLLNFSIREISYLFFCLLLLADAQWELLNNFSAKVYFVKLIPWMGYVTSYQFPGVVFTFLLVLFFVLFSQYFLKLRTRLPKLNRIISVGLILTALIVILSLSGVETPPEIFIASILISTFILCIVAAIISWYKGNKESRFYVFAALVLIISIFLSKQPVLFVYSLFNIGLLLFYIILTVALGDKIKIMRIEKETAQETALEVLEEKVQERTEEVVKQKHLVEEKQKEIIDSITYAKRLQEAILPPKEFVNKYIPDNFILYRPKDLVAGDFYWAEKIGDNFYIAAADSTGHGVPGAMVSVVCSNALNRTVKEFKETETGKILDKTRELVVETFEKSISEVKDGMDISLLCVDLKNKKITWSGANNPLWYIQNNEMKEIKANKQPIGKTENPQAFTTHLINYEERSTFYLFTDGLADQFGGPNGKKFKYKQFSDLLVMVSSHSPVEQSRIIDKTLADWKGSLEQVDDVCVIGIRI